MFLTKKNASNAKKQNNNKALGGWDDNEDLGPSGSSANYTKMNDDKHDKNLSPLAY